MIVWEDHTGTEIIANSEEMEIMINSKETEATEATETTEAKETWITVTGENNKYIMEYIRTDLRYTEVTNYN